MMKPITSIFFLEKYYLRVTFLKNKIRKLTYNQLFFKKYIKFFFYNKKNRYFMVFSNTYMLPVRYVQISLT
ncbi:hypothetical protein ASFVK49_0730 [African swine fever virus]|nr:hypothetical protein ASFVK49_0730 [African swine fever virus]